MERNAGLIKNARHLRKNMTKAEWAMWDMLRSPACRFCFRRQYAIEPYIIDFYCPELRLVIEVDGGQHGDEKDHKRDCFLKEKDYRVLRFWNNDVLTNPQGVWMKLELLLNDLAQLPRVTPTLTLPLKGEGISRTASIMQAK